ncbi:F-box/kelch-repeat protein [Hibiscus syriacus]|uniref:F-box/kelch-repeat protein n=1 Tax=Hibiscus syriacus TaxID=106335 RepID=A0A6A3CT99_HIBSY|nr:proline-rich extensin-like protein EPR1 [Hibiscus syriacus]KAE8730469.1 F-box/kelch-repeat protein [Hibiscus syriacus]
MSWFLFTLLLSFFNGFSEGSHESAVVVGTVYCDTCFQQPFPSAAHFISGATVAVECRDGKRSRPSFRQQVKTNKHGEFKVRLPFSVSKHVKKIEGCAVKLIKSSEPYCAVASSATSSSLHLKSRKQGTHVFSAGFFSFKPLKQPFLCNQKPSVDSLKQLKNKPQSSVHPDQLLPPPVLPPNPFLPPPVLPPNPFLPPPVLPPNPILPPPVLPPNPILPPPVLPPNPILPPPVLPPNPVLPPPVLPPNPFLPPPVLPPNPFLPPPVLPPNPLQPPPAPEIPNPLEPPPAPLTPSLPPIPVLPPLPFPPIPPFPGVPPAKSSP